MTRHFGNNHVQMRLEPTQNLAQTKSEMADVTAQIVTVSQLFGCGARLNVDKSSGQVLVFN